MKKILLIMIAVVMALALVACGEKTSENTQVQNNQPSSSVQTNNVPANTNTNADENANATATPAQATNSKGIAPAKDGTLTLSKADLAVVVNGTSVQMPYNLKELETAGVPADESRSEIKLGAGDIFSANLYLDDNEDYLLIPAYQNKGDSEITITEAKAEEITMTTYADEPVDQGVSIFGVPFGMTRKEVKALLGEPKSDEGSYFEWHLEIPDMSYEGTLSLYVTEDSDDAGVSQINLNVFEK